jgi:eukaryotic-like serine/threonine-protein kinase
VSVAAEPRPSSPDLERLTAFGAPGGPALDEALRLFAHLRTTPDERRSIGRLLARNAQAPLPEPLLVAVAAALLDRGEDAAAASALAQATSSPALAMRAEVAARAGDLATAVALIERVLSRDIDWPGARERHARWEDELGIARPAPRIGAWETVAASAPGAPFELLREVGRGGAGAVYEAKDRVLGRTVALKMYHQPDRDRAQLLHEARVAVALAGPGVVRVFDVDLEHGWIALQWARLGALRTLFRSRTIERLVPLALWAVPLARALARVHAAGWVHHDVKPANLLFDTYDAPWISDFGTARRIGEPSPPGSLGYVSPERLAGRASDPRDDVYGFGRVLEDALDVLGDTDETSGVRLEPWRTLAQACVGKDLGRPSGGAELVARALGGEKS